MRQPDNPLYRNAKEVESDLEDYGDAQYAPGKLYHVTTNLSAVRRDEALKSRRQLGGQAKTSGLGGGAKNEASNKISLTYNFGRAQEIYQAIKYVVNICQGKVKASQVYYHLHDSGDNHGRDEEDGELSNIENYLTDFVPEQIVRDEESDKIARILDKKIKGAAAVYDFFVGMEQAAVEDQHAGASDWPEEPLVYNVIGFTAPFQNMSRIQPNDVAIIQCLVRKNAPVQHEPSEVELRINPEDIVILRYMQP